MTKPVGLLLFLAVLAGAASAEATDPCAGLDGSALNQCRNNQQALRQQQLEQLLQQQTERQNQLDRQQREVQQQLETMRQQNEAIRQQNEAMRRQNESLRQEMEREISNPLARQAATGQAEPVRSQDLRDWKADNPWFGSDYTKTQYAMRSLKQLQQDHPELAGRALLDALSARVNEKFGGGR